MLLYIKNNKNNVKLKKNTVFYYKNIYKSQFFIIIKANLIYNIKFFVCKLKVIFSVSLLLISVIKCVLTFNSCNSTFIL